VDTANDEVDLKAWPAKVAAGLGIALFLAGTYIVAAMEDGSVSLNTGLALIGVIIAILLTIAVVMHRLQEHGGVWFNLHRSRRGFRVVVKPKDKQ